jgi:predicted metal-dependent phosphoesterase TrpH
MPQQIKVDFHCHTTASDDGRIPLEKLIDFCDHKGINKIAITDHNTLDSALDGAARWPDRIIPGLEIMTNRGELIAYYVWKPVEQGQDPYTTIQALKDQDAVISVSHPFDIFRNGGWKLSRLLEIVPYLDAIEIFNAHCITGLPNLRAKAFAHKYGLAGTAGSDAHDQFEIGAAGLTLPDFHNSGGLRFALRSATRFGRRTSIGTRLFNRLNHLSLGTR